MPATGLPHSLYQRHIKSECLNSLSWSCSCFAICLLFSGSTLVQATRPSRPDLTVSADRLHYSIPFAKIDVSDSGLLQLGSTNNSSACADSTVFAGVCSRYVLLKRIISDDNSKYGETDDSEQHVDSLMTIRQSSLRYRGGRRKHEPAHPRAFNTPRYYLNRSKGPLGHGSFGEAWLAEDKTRDNAMVVLKIFKENGRYVYGEEKASFDASKAGGPDSDHHEDGGLSSDKTPTISVKQSLHIDELERECQLAQHIHRTVSAADADRFMDCSDLRIKSAGEPIFIAVSYCGKTLGNFLDEADDVYRRGLPSNAGHGALKGYAGRCPCNDDIEGGPVLSPYDPPSDQSVVNLSAGMLQTSTSCNPLRKKALVVDLFQQLLEAQSVLEELQLSHHDLKPKNLAVDAAGKLHMIDFGSMSKWGDECSTVFTWGYAPPEFMETGVDTGRKKCHGAFDMYSLGGILLNLVQKGGDHKRQSLIQILCHDLSSKGLAKACSRYCEKEQSKSLRHRIIGDAFSLLERLRLSDGGLFSHPGVRDTIDDAILDDSAFMGFLNDFMMKALDPDPAARPRARDVLNSPRFKGLVSEASIGFTQKVQNAAVLRQSFAYSVSDDFSGGESRDSAPDMSY